MKMNEILLSCFALKHGRARYRLILQLQQTHSRETAIAKGIGGLCPKGIRARREE